MKKKRIFAWVILMICVGSIALASNNDDLKLANEARIAGEAEKAFGLYEQFLSNNPGDERVPEALFWSAQMIPEHGGLELVLFGSHSMWTQSLAADVDLEGHMSQQERLWKIYNEYAGHWAWNHTPFLLAEILAAGDPDQAEALYREALETSTASRRAEAALALIYQFIAAENYQEALEIVEYAQREIPRRLAVEMQFAKGDIHAALGNTELAKAAYEAVPAIHAREIHRMEAMADSSGAAVQRQDMLLMVDEYASQVRDRVLALLFASETNAATIEGQVTIDGKSLAGTTVLINPKQENIIGVTTRHPYFEVRTDAEGRFSVQVPAGRDYEVGLLLTGRQVDDPHMVSLVATNDTFHLAPGTVEEVTLQVQTQ